MGRECVIGAGPARARRRKDARLRINWCLVVHGCGENLNDTQQYAHRIGYAGLAGSQSSTLFPSGSMTQANFPYSESSIFSSTLQPSSFKALTKA